MRSHHRFLMLTLVTLFAAATSRNAAAQPTPTLIDLGSLGSSGALAINDSGDVVGVFQYASGISHAFLWKKGKLTDLGTPTGAGNSVAHDINNRGQVVGDFLPGGNGSTFIWEYGQMTDFGPLGGVASSALGINNHGQVVGEAYTPGGNTYAFLWKGGKLTDLALVGNSCAYAINDRGAGRGLH